MKNYYEILEVNQKASKEVIEKAYKVLVMKYHPDSQSGQVNEDKIKDINEAYKILSDDFLREQYDNELLKEQQKKYELNQENQQMHKKSKNKKEKNVEASEYKVGSFMNLIQLTKEIVANRPKHERKKEITQKDVLAVFLTIVAVIVIGIILWFIPFTNGWMRQLLCENALFNWIGGLFS